MITKSDIIITNDFHILHELVLLINLRGGDFYFTGRKLRHNKIELTTSYSCT